MSDRPPRWAVYGTMLAALAFIGAVIVYVPYALSGWHPAPTTFGGEPPRWVGALMIVLAFHLFVVLVEEPALRRTFGPAYDAYRRQVPRWIPRIPPRPNAPPE